MEDNKFGHIFRMYRNSLYLLDGQSKKVQYDDFPKLWL